MKATTQKSVTKSESRVYVQKMLSSGAITKSMLEEADAIFKKIEHLKTPQKEIEFVRLVLARKDGQLRKAA